MNRLSAGQTSFRYFLISIIPLYFCFLIQLSAQQKMIQYDKDFVFKDGIYLSIFDFKGNKPIPVSKIIFNSNKGDKDFLKYVLDKTTITYLDSTGKLQEVKTETTWGYCSNGTVYINHGTGFSRLSIIGNICHFVSTVAVQTGYDPFSYNDPFGSTYPRYTYVSQQFVMDFDSGKILDFNVGSMEILLQKDDALYKEFTALKKKKKRDSIFLYLRKFNEKHPVYFPE